MIFELPNGQWIKTPETGRVCVTLIRYDYYDTWIKVLGWSGFYHGAHFLHLTSERVTFDGDTLYIEAADWAKLVKASTVLSYSFYIENYKTYDIIEQHRKEAI